MSTKLIFLWWTRTRISWYLIVFLYNNNSLFQPTSKPTIGWANKNGYTSIFIEWDHVHAIMQSLMLVSLVTTYMFKLFYGKWCDSLWYLIVVFNWTHVALYAFFSNQMTLVILLFWDDNDYMTVLFFSSVLAMLQKTLPSSDNKKRRGNCCSSKFPNK